MAKVDFIRPIEAIHGKLAKSDVIGFAQMHEANADEERVKFTRNHTKRNLKKHPYTSAELAQQKRFGDICKLATARSKNETKALQDANGFRTNPGAAKTLKQYVWNQAEAEYAG